MSAIWRTPLALARRFAPALVAGFFAAAATGKLVDPARFAVDIDHYRLLPPVASAAVASYLPWFELALAVGLLLPRWRETTRVLALFTLGVFCAALASAWARGLDLRCGCLGASESVATSPLGALVRNAVLAGLLLLGRPRSPRPLTAMPGGRDGAAF